MCHRLSNSRVKLLSCEQYEMLFVLYAILQVIPLLCNATPPPMFVKPSFAPYCTIKDRCRSVCSCQITPSCDLLPMDDSIRDSILFYHNQIRQIQTYAEPEPAGMTMLQYDMQLEELSKCWALRCDNEYSSCFITPRYPETSQSVVQLLIDEGKTSSTFFWVQILNFWLGETKSISAESINVMPGGEKGEKLHNYAQLLGDSIQSVGCAWSNTNGSITFVCTYGPRGPIWGEPIYKRGKPCTGCPENYGCDSSKPFQNLCKEGIGITTMPSKETPPSPPPQPPTTSSTTTTVSTPTTSTVQTSVSPFLSPTPETMPPEPPPLPPNSCAGLLDCSNSEKTTIVPAEFRESPPKVEKSHDAQGINPQNIIPLTRSNLVPLYRNEFSTESSRAVPVTNQRYMESRDFYYDQKQLPVMPQERKTNFEHHENYRSDYKPLVPLRNIPHPRLMSPSLISKPIQPIGHPKAFTMNRNNSVHSIQQRLRILEATDLEPSQLVQSFKAVENQMTYRTPQQVPHLSNPQSEILHNAPYQLANEQLSDPRPNIPSLPSIPRPDQALPPQSPNYYPDLGTPLSKQQSGGSPINMPQKPQFNRKHLELAPTIPPSSILYPPPGALAPPQQPVPPRPQGQLLSRAQPLASIMPPYPESPTERFPRGRYSRRHHRRNSSERIFISRNLLALLFISHFISSLGNKN